MRILFVARQLKRPFSGQDIRITRLMRGVPQRHDVHAVYLARQDGPPPDPEDEGCDVIRVPTDRAPLGRPNQPARNLLRLLRNTSYHGLLDCDPESARALDAFIAQYDPDVVQFESSYLGDYLLHARRTHPQLPIVLDCFDLEWRQQQQLAQIRETTRKRLRLHIKSRHTVRRERQAFMAASLVFMASPDELAIARRMAPGARFMSVPNGADFSEGTLSDGPPVPGRPLYVGNIRYWPYAEAVLWFAREVWPDLRKRHPGVSFEVVGREPTPEVLKLAEQPGISVTGPVESVRPYLEAAQVVVVPLRSGTGTRLKVLEGLAAGRPVVSTSVGAEGLDLTPEKHLLIADSAGAFADDVARLLKDDALRSELATAGRNHAKAIYDWQHIADAASEAYDQLVEDAQ